MTGLELFRCDAFGCRLTRQACSRRHAVANGPPQSGPKGSDRLAFALCRGCGTGAAHARGERPDVDVMALVRREEVEMPMPKKRYEGKTLDEWVASEANVHKLTESTLKSRAASGMSTRDALARALDPRAARFKPKPAKKVAAVESPATEPAKAPSSKKPSPKLTASTVRAPAGDIDVALVLTRLGYRVEDCGVVPAGRLLLVHEARDGQ